MYRPISRVEKADYLQTLLTGIALWLLAGSILLLTGLLPIHSVLLGWSLPFWLVLTPLLLTLIVAPDLPGQWLRQRRSRRRVLRASPWI